MDKKLKLMKGGYGNREREREPFSELVKRTGRGAFLAGTAGDWVPQLTDALPSR